MTLKLECSCTDCLLVLLTFFRETEREAFTCFSSWLCIYWLLLLRALTQDQTCNLGAHCTRATLQPSELPAGPWYKFLQHTHICTFILLYTCSYVSSKVTYRVISSLIIIISIVILYDNWLFRYWVKQKF